MNRRQFLMKASGAAAALAATGDCGVVAALPADATRARRPRVATGPLRVRKVNPRYFTDGSGRAIYLTGSHLGWELQDNAWGREHIINRLKFALKHILRGEIR